MKRKLKTTAHPSPALPAQASPKRRAEIHPLDQAIGELRSQLARTPDDPSLLSRLGLLYYRRGDLAEAQRLLQQAIALAPRNPVFHNNLGNVLCDMGKMRDGIAAYESALAVEKVEFPERIPSPEVAANLELAKLEYRLIDERIEYLERAAQLEVSSAEALNTLGCGYLLRGERMPALAAFRSAAAIDPRNVFAGLNCGFSHALTHLSDPKPALAECAEFIVRFPGEPRLFIHCGELYENAGQLEEAEEQYLRAARADQRCLEAYDLLGKLRTALGFARPTDECARAIEEILAGLEKRAREEGAPDSPNSPARALYDLALAAVARSRFSGQPVAQAAEVEKLLRRVMAAKNAGPERAAAAVLCSQLVEGDGRRKCARKILDPMCEAHPLHCALWLERGGVALRAGDINEALVSFDRATLCAPQDARGYHSLRYAFEGFRRYSTERVRFEIAVKTNPRDALAYYHMALAELSVLKDEGALFNFTRALELDPRLADAACGRARALQRLGHAIEAEAAFRHTLELDPEHREAKRQLAGLMAHKNNQGNDPHQQNGDQHQQSHDQPV